MGIDRILIFKTSLAKKANPNTDCCIIQINKIGDQFFILLSLKGVGENCSETAIKMLDKSVYTPINVWLCAVFTIYSMKGMVMGRVIVRLKYWNSLPVPMLENSFVCDTKKIN